MDQSIRNELRNVVTKCRKLLEEAVSQVLQGQFGIYASGKKDEVHVEDESRMKNLSEEDKGYRRDIQAHLGHIEALGYKAKDSLAQLVREIAFTHLNRLCAYKMMEARAVWVGGKPFRESVSRGMKSQGFLFYLADHTEDKKLFDTGHQDVAYRHFLGWLGALLSEEIGVLFSPTDPANRLFPPQRVLDDVLALLNSDGLKDIWTEDETIGWVYQYFTPKELRDQVRKESAAPRNSYELAFRNQFFTPRYVVEFLTDNTLGRIWYEMRKGNTKLKDQCRYMVRHPSEVFLADGQTPPEPPQNQEELSQEELLKQPVHIPHRPKKDPRELRILDPACGSGHFLLYCFALLLAIYEEAYADPDLGPKLKEEYPTLEALRRDVPRLILANNLYGIDIDLRATQIAALALWLRCQCAFGEMGLKQDRPKITKSNIVCAEPMPGENDMLKEFIAQLQPRLLGHLVEVVFDEMKLAGEAGSLLKIEEDLRDAIAEAKQRWVAEHEQATDRKGRPLLFSRAEMERLANKPPQPQLFDLSEITDERFWSEAEYHVLTALRSYAAHASNDGKLQRQLFAENASQGFALIDVCSTKHDVVLMNPPFGEPTPLLKVYLEQAYPRTKTDAYAAFIERSLRLASRRGLVGAITPRTGFFLSSFTRWRNDILLNEAQPKGCADLGYGVLDTAMVETAAYCIESDRPSQSVTATFLRLLQHEDKASALSAVIDRFREGQHIEDTMYIVAPSSFTKVPGSPFAYWISDRIRQLFVDFPRLENEERIVKQGLATADDFRFVRAWWEIPAAAFLDGTAFPDWDTESTAFRKWCSDTTCRGTRWVPFAKGGDYAPYYADLVLVVDWENEGSAIKNRINKTTGKPFSNVWQLRGTERDYFYREGITWSRRTNSGFSPRILPKGAIFADKGPALFVPKRDLLSCLAILFSRTYQQLIDVKMATGDETQSGTQSRSYEVGVVQALPWPALSDVERSGLEKNVGVIVYCIRNRESWDETTRGFTSLFARSDVSLSEGAAEWHWAKEEQEARCLPCAADIERTVCNVLRLPSTSLSLSTGDARNLCSLPNQEPDKTFDDIYTRSIHETIREELDEHGGNRDVAVKTYYLSRRLELLSHSFRTHPEVVAATAKQRKLVPDGLVPDACHRSLSYFVGVWYGRWDIRLWEHDEPACDVTAPLGLGPSGLLRGPDGLFVSQTPLDYPLQINVNGIVPDDPDHTDDIVRRVREVLELIWKDRAEAIEKEVCEILGVKELRDYFRKPGKGGFWDDHVSRYSKSRRKAPIYWLLQSTKKNYALWLYYHRLDKDILFKARQNYVDPKIRLEQTRLDSLRSQKTALGAEAKGAKKIDKDIERQETLLVELKDFADKLDRAAKLNFGNPEKLDSAVAYDPDLNDGVVLSIAPLWELVPWKEAKSYWEELLEGKYEWSSMGKLLRKKGLVK
jgi:hypothetical protein